MFTRLLDLIVSLLGCLLLLLLLPFIALLIKLDSRGPVFFKCDRVGKDGKIFQMYKFRTMYDPPVTHWESVSPRGDPRVTPVGRVLRRLKLNELPQFLNVLKGEMTLIGPRPEAPDLAALYPPEAQAIFAAKPGIFGPNQIWGRNEEEFYPPGVDAKQYYINEILPRKLPQDLQYLREKSFLKDLKYLLWGVWVTLSRVVSRQHITDNVSQILMLLADMVLCLASFTLAHLLRFEGWSTPQLLRTYLKFLPLTVLARIPFLFYFGCYQTLLRYLGMRDLWQTFKAVTLGSGALVLISYFSGLIYAGYSRGVLVIDWLCLAMLLTGYRVLLKVLAQQREKSRNGLGAARRVLVWGAGEEGRWCLRYLQEDHNPPYEVVGFIDEEPRMQHKKIEGRKVLGDSHHLEVLSQLYKVQEVFLAASGVPPHKVARVQALCHRLGISFRRFVPHTVKEIAGAPSPEIVLPLSRPARRAVILAGGKGVRLSPVTEVIPKPLVPVGGMPVLEIVIRQLQAHGFERITLAVGYQSELIQAYFNNGSKWGVQIDYSSESEPLGTAGPLALIDGLTDTFLVMNADVLTDIDYQELFRFHAAQGGLATVAAYEKQVQIDLGVIVKDGTLFIRDYVEKPLQKHLVSMGIYVFEPRVLDYIYGPVPLDFPDLVKRLLQHQQPVVYYPFSGYWLDIGRHEDYATACEEFARLQAKLLKSNGP